MKLHIEALQEKLDSAMKEQKKVEAREKEMASLRKELSACLEISQKVEADAKKSASDLAKCQKRLEGLEVDKQKLELALVDK